MYIFFVVSSLSHKAVYLLLQVINHLVQLLHACFLVVQPIETINGAYNNDARACTASRCDWKCIKLLGQHHNAEMDFFYFCHSNPFKCTFGHNAT